MAAAVVVEHQDAATAAAAASREVEEEEVGSEDDEEESESGESIESGSEAGLENGVISKLKKRKKKKVRLGGSHCKRCGPPSHARASPACCQTPLWCTASAPCTRTATEGAPMLPAEEEKGRRRRSGGGARFAARRPGGTEGGRAPIPGEKIPLCRACLAAIARSALQDGPAVAAPRQCLPADAVVCLPRRLVHISLASCRRR